MLGKTVALGLLYLALVSAQLPLVRAWCLARDWVWSRVCALETAWWGRPSWVCTVGCSAASAASAL